MAILDDIAGYARLCLEDTKISEYEDYISCQAHKWAMTAKSPLMVKR